MKKLRKYKWSIIGVLLGGIGGYLYWKEIGCLTGACTLQSQWQTMVPYGMFVGYIGVDILLSIFNPYKNN